MEWDIDEILGNSKDLKSSMLILNQPLDKLESFVLSKWDKACLHIAVDGGLLCLHELANRNSLNLVPELVTGDFDSISSEQLDYYKCKGSKIVRTDDQDATDFTKALIEMMKVVNEKNMKLESVLVITLMAGRLDHIMSNLQTLYLAKQMNCPPVYLISDKCVTWLLSKGKHKIKINSTFHNLSVGLIPLNPCIVTTDGLKWELDNTELKFGGLISTSNTYKQDRNYVIVETSDDLIWTMETS
ncbi:thiamine pyrophosphokinase 1 [Centruroides vittatus]|uniref:thiamine pyrophosphokinase 1 n=1 Tax=Centruroides vittatus TaxID=120091 RepID=UPI0035104B16